MNVQDVQKLPFELHRIFNVQDSTDFDELALKIFRFQYEHSSVYRSFIELSRRDVSKVQKVEDIPFLPISFFKQHEIKAFEGTPSIEFQSSGTTGFIKSRHFIADPTVYQMSFLKGFERFYGHIEEYIVLGLLPSYMESEHSSLIYMVDHLIELSADHDSGFFLNDYEKLLKIIQERSGDKKIILIGVSYALLDFAEKFSPDLSNCIVMETGGMKGRRKEMTRDELHSKLKMGFKVEHIHSEYGMTELLSQAYAPKNGVFHSPPWMKIFIRKHNDPFELTTKGSGGINVVDFANVYSCSFIETEDLGRFQEGGFEVLGRLDNSDVRGCNLLIE